MNLLTLVVVQKLSFYVQFFFSFPFTEDEGKPGRESVQHSSVLMLKANTLIRDGRCSILLLLDLA